MICITPPMSGATINDAKGQEVKTVIIVFFLNIAVRHLKDETQK